LKKDSYQGMPSGVPFSAKRETGFSRWPEGKSQRLKPLR
jgi:hypothetical protein